MSVHPNTPNVNLSAKNQETLEELVKIISFADGLTLLFAKCNVPTLRRTLANQWC